MEYPVNSSFRKKEGRPVILFHFYTLAVMVVMVICATMSLGAYFSSRRTTHLYVMAGAVFYFFDCSLIFLDDYIDLQYGFDPELFYSVPHPFLRTFLAAGVLGCANMVVCEYMDVKSKVLRAAPTCVFIVVALAVILLLPTSPQTQMLYYSMRQVYLLYIALFAALRYVTLKSDSRKKRMRKMWSLLLFTLVMIAVIVAEDAHNILIAKLPEDVSYTDLLTYVSERSISENLLGLFFGIFSIRKAGKSLALRYSMTPETAFNEVAAMQLDDSLPRFAEHHGLTKRESEVLRLLLDGKDNQNIASTMGISIGTVKAHVNHIYGKVGVKTRQEIKERFWSE